VTFIAKRAADVAAWDLIKLPGDRLATLVVDVTPDSEVPGLLHVETHDGVASLKADDLVDVELELWEGVA
jgi:hypothetical protein